MECIILNCPKKPEYICNCKDSGIVLCKPHSIDHCLENGHHKLKKINKDLNEYDSAVLAEILLANHNILQDLKKKLSNIASKLISAIYKENNKIMKTILLKEKNISSALSKIATEKEISFESYDNLIKDEGLEFKLDEAFFKISEIEWSVKKFFSANFLESVQKQHNSSNIFTSTLGFFKKNSKDFVKFDVKTFKTEVIPMNLDCNMGSLAGWCQLPNKKIFHYGGQKSALKIPLTKCCIIYPEINYIEMKADGPVPLYKIGLCCYHNDYVYLFGGSTILSALSSEVYRYDLINDNWQKLQSLPFRSDHNSCITKNYNIWVTGSKLGLLEYDITNNCYNEKFCKSDSYKLIFRDEKTVYLLIDKESKV